ncbi:MAG: glycosyltransferase family 4 protein [Hyphomicrobiales bacterium]|nr:glycosyltransferase family 4 protein [Hyphomicrobiales bacterium]
MTHPSPTNLSRADDGRTGPKAIAPWGTNRARRRLRRWIDRRDDTRPTVLFIHHSGGGTVRYAKTVAELLSGAATVIYGVGLKEREFLLCRDPDRSQAGIAFKLPEDKGDLIAAVHDLGVARVNVFHAMGFEARLGELLEAWRLPYDITLTDYHLAAVDPHLLDGTLRYAADGARKTMKRTRPAFVDGAERLVACSGHLAAGMRHFWPDLPIVASAPIDTRKRANTRVRWRPIWPGEALRVLLINALSKVKGKDAWTAVAKIAAAEGLPVTFHILHHGNVPPDSPGVTNHQSGRRDLAKATAKLVRTVKPHLAWFPFQAPETHSFALSDALANRLPVLASATASSQSGCSGGR